MNNKPILDFFRRHGIQILELELGPNTPPHIGEQTLNFGIFDGFALAAINDDTTNGVTPVKFIKLTYPKLAELNVGDHYRDYVRRYRFAGQIEVDCELFPEDAAVCFGQAHEITHADFEHSLKMALSQNGNCPKYLHIYCTEDDFLAHMDGMVYGVAGMDGKWLCDIYQTEFITLTDSKILIDTNEDWDFKAPAGSESDVLLRDESNRQRVYKQRLEIIRLQ